MSKILEKLSSITGIDVEELKREILNESQTENKQKVVKVPLGTNNIVCLVCKDSYDPKLRRIVISFGTGDRFNEVRCGECQTLYQKSPDVTRITITE